MRFRYFRLLLLSIQLLPLTNLFGQWKNNIADNGFEKPRKYALCLCADEGKEFFILNVRKPLNDTTKSLWFEFWALKEKFCEKSLKVDLSFQMDTGRFVLYDIDVVRLDCFYKDLSDDDRATMTNKIVISPNLLFWNINQLRGAFGKCNVLRVRIKDGVCGTETYTFNMTGSASALKWVNSQ